MEQENVCDEVRRAFETEVGTIRNEKQILSFGNDGLVDQANQRPNEIAELQRQIEGLNQRLEEAERGAEQAGAHTQQLVAPYEQRIQALNEQLMREQG